MATAVVRYGLMGRTDVFSVGDAELAVGSHVIVRTPRGVEWGEVTKLRPDGGGAAKPAGDVLRRATAADHEKLEHIEDVEQVEEFRCCKQLIKTHGLPDMTGLRTGP